MQEVTADLIDSIVGQILKLLFIVQMHKVFKHKMQCSDMMLNIRLNICLK